MKCDVCEESFRNNKLLKKHKKTHKAANQLTCPECGKVLSSKTSLRNHQLTHKRTKLQFKCNRCDMVFKRSAALEKHKEEHLRKKGFECVKWNTTKSKSKKQTVQHKQSCQQDIEHYECELCGKKYQRSSAYNRHMQQHDTGACDCVTKKLSSCHFCCIVDVFALNKFYSCLNFVTTCFCCFCRKPCCWKCFVENSLSTEFEDFIVY